MTEQNEQKKKVQSGTLKKKRLTIRLNDNEYRWLQNTSDETGLAKSDILRLALHDDKQQRMAKQDLSKEDREAIIKCLMDASTIYSKMKQELHNTGNNVNQIATALNRNANVDTTLIAQVLAKYIEIVGRNENSIAQQARAVNDLWQLLK